MEILLLALLVVVFLGLPVLQMRKQSKQIGVIKNFQASLQPGMVVQLTSGLHGRLSNVGETTVDVEVAPGVVTTWDRGAVLKLIDSVDADSTQARHLTGADSDNLVPDDLSGLDDLSGDTDSRTDSRTDNRPDNRTEGHANGIDRSESLGDTPLDENRRPDAPEEDGGAGEDSGRRP